MIRICVALAFVIGCISQAKQAIAPEPEGGGTLSCKEVVEQCDSQCSDPLCLHQCTPQGTDEARTQHAALLDCGQRNGCTGQDCMEQNCTAEIQTCMGPALNEGDMPATAPAPSEGATEPSSDGGATAPSPGQGS